MQLTSVVLPAPLGPISPTTSCLRTSRSTPCSAATPSKARATPVARRPSTRCSASLERHRLARLHRPGEARLAVLDLDHPVLPAARAVELLVEAHVPRDCLQVGEALHRRG